MVEKVEKFCKSIADEISVDACFFIAVALLFIWCIDAIIRLKFGLFRAGIVLEDIDTAITAHAKGEDANTNLTERVSELAAGSKAVNGAWHDFLTDESIKPSTAFEKGRIKNTKLFVLNPFTFLFIAAAAIISIADKIGLQNVDWSLSNKKLIDAAAIPLILLVTNLLLGIVFAINKAQLKRRQNRFRVKLHNEIDAAFSGEMGRLGLFKLAYFTAIENGKSKKEAMEAAKETFKISANLGAEQRRTEPLAAVISESATVQAEQKPSESEQKAGRALGTEMTDIDTDDSFADSPKDSETVLQDKKEQENIEEQDSTVEKIDDTNNATAIQPISVSDTPNQEELTLAQPPQAPEAMPEITQPPAELMPTLNQSQTAPIPAQPSVPNLDLFNGMKEMQMNMLKEAQFTSREQELMRELGREREKNKELEKRVEQETNAMREYKLNMEITYLKDSLSKLMNKLEQQEMQVREQEAKRRAENAKRNEEELRLKKELQTLVKKVAAPKVVAKPASASPTVTATARLRPMGATAEQPKPSAPTTPNSSDSSAPAAVDSTANPNAPKS